MSAHQSYRQEIDGLRAIAVLAVVFYHFSVPGFGGGFVGVDIFFVISGFLIGGILWRELVANGHVSFARFYTRRLRRLAPAFVVMALVSGLAAYFILLPYEFREFGKALIASTVYLSNVLFFRQSGYFDNAADEKLLLHTWSLSVEEQFYIFLPLLILIFTRSPRVLHWLLMMIFVTSLASCILFTRTSHTATFFLFPFRAWELLAGVLLAIHGQQKSESWRHGALPSFIGLALVLLGILFIKAGDGFPGWQVLVPVLGAVLLIWNGRDENIVNRLLASPLPVFVGLVSYSLYLWHWPVLVLSKYFRDGYSMWESTLWMALVLGLSVVSWRFVERPVRQSNLSGWPMVAAVGATSMSLVALGAVVYLHNGMPNRFDAQTRAHIAASSDFLQDWSRCFVPENGAFKGVETCPIGPEGQPEVLVWGDSHVRAFQAGISLIATEMERPGLLIWQAGCPPLFGVGKTESAATLQENMACRDALETMRKAVTEVPSIRKLMVVGRWNYYAEGKGVGNDAHNTITLQGDSFERASRITFTELANHFEKVFVLRQMPEIPRYDSRKVARQLAHGRIEKQELNEVTMVLRKDVAARSLISEGVFQQLQAEKTITYLDSWGVVCDAEICSAVVDDKALYFDNNHITNTASLMMRELFDPVFQPVSQVP